MKSLEKRDTTSQILYDLIERRSNCDYTQQIVDGLLENEELVSKLTELAEPTIEKAIKLPAARLDNNTTALTAFATSTLLVSKVGIAYQRS